MDLQQLQNLLQNQGMPGGAGDGGGPLVSFKAGKLNMAGTKVTADTRKGTVSVERSPDGLVQLKWKTRPNGKVENDFTIIPTTAKWEKVPECKDGRCFLLRVSGAKHFFWMQEPKDDKDEEHFKKINELFNDTGSGAPQGGLDQAALLQMVGGGGAGGAGGTGGGDNQNQSQPRQAAAQQAAPQQAAPQQAAPQQAAPQQAASQQSSSQQNAQAAAMAQIRALMNDPRQKFLFSEGALSKILEPEEVVPLLSDDDETVKGLLELLPPEHQSKEHLISTLRSPQFQQALGRLQSVVASAEGGVLINQLQLPFLGVGLDPFLRAVQQVGDKEKTDEEKDSESKPDDDAEMADAS